MLPKAPAEYISIIDAIDLPTDRSLLDQDDLLIGREGKLSVFYAPCDSINAEAKVVLLGLMNRPGFDGGSLVWFSHAASG